MRNEIERISKLLTESFTAEDMDVKPVVIYSNAINRFLRIHNPAHVKQATAWRYDLKAAKLHTNKGNPFDDIKFGDDNERGYSPTGYWIPRIHTFIAYGYMNNGRFVYPEQKLIDYVTKRLEATDIRHIFIVKGV